MSGAQRHKRQNDLHPTEKRWFAVRTSFKWEKLVQGWLRKKNIEVYLPLLHVVRRYKTKTKHLQIPLINNFVFVNIVESEYIKVLETEGAIFFLRDGKDLKAIPEREIAVLRLVVGEKVDSSINVVPISYDIGQAVEIVRGQLAGIKGKLVEKKGKKNFVVELMGLDLELRMEIDMDMIRPLV